MHMLNTLQSRLINNADNANNAGNANNSKLQ